MKNYDKSIIPTYLTYLATNKLYGWAMSHKVSVNCFKWVKKLLKFNESFIKQHDENSNKGFFLDVDVEYPKPLFNLHKDLSFLPERKKIGNCKKLLCGIEDKEKYIVYISALKQALNHGLILKRVHRVIQLIKKHI